MQFVKSTTGTGKHDLINPDGGWELKAGTPAMQTYPLQLPPKLLRCAVASAGDTRSKDLQ
jgi:hypothetical protein